MQLKEYWERRAVSVSFTLYINLYEIFSLGFFILTQTQDDLVIGYIGD